MQREKDSATDTLEKWLWDAAVQFCASSGLGVTRYSQRFLGLSLLLVWAAFCYSVRADSWSSPGPFDALSENRQFIAHVTPAAKNSKATVVVSERKVRQTNEIWRAILSNPTSPEQVLVGDEGTGIVTLDNWGGVGYGDDVVAIYGPGGLKAKFSLEDFAPPRKPARNPASTPDFISLATEEGYRSEFMHSTSSRHWRGYSIYFFYRNANEVLFCLWLDWDNRWVVWQMADGKLAKVTPDLAKNLNREARTRALRWATTGDYPFAALSFLGRLHHPEDRPLIEAYLRAKEFSTGYSMTYSGESKPFLRYGASSFKRQEAEKILSCSDGFATNISTIFDVENYHYLGTIKGRVFLSAAPRKGDGSLRLYLIPATLPLEKWSDSKPEHYLIADFQDDFPVEYVGQQLKDFPLTQAIDFVFCGVTAGDYRMKVVWNKTPPLTNSEAIICRPKAGDYESVNSPMISVKRGKVFETVEIQCKTPFSRQ